VATTHWPVYSPIAKEHFGKGKAEGKDEGKAEGKAEEAQATVLMVLEARGLNPTDSERTQVGGCTDLDQLRKWTVAALTASSTRDVFQ
jgi:hypothetical protein